MDFLFSKPNNTCLPQGPRKQFLPFPFLHYFRIKTFPKNSLHTDIIITKNFLDQTFTLINTIWHSAVARQACQPKTIAIRRVKAI